MTLILKEQQDEFLNSMRKRANELEDIYRPIFDPIPEERQREMENEVEDVAAVRRTEENKQIDVIQGTLDEFLDI